MYQILEDFCSGSLHYKGGHVYHQACGEALQRMPNPRCCLCRVSIHKLTLLFFGANRESAGVGIEGAGGDKVESDVILEKATIASLEGRLWDEMQKVNGLRNDIDCLETKKGRLKGRLREALAKADQLQERVEALETAQRARDRTIAQLSTVGAGFERLLQETEEKVRGLQKELESVRSISLAKDMEKVLKDFGDFQTQEYIQSLSRQPVPELVSQCALLLLRGRGQERDMVGLQEELRKAKIEAEGAQRQLRKIQREARGTCAVDTGSSLVFQPTTSSTVQDKTPSVLGKHSLRAVPEETLEFFDMLSESKTIVVDHSPPLPLQPFSSFLKSGSSYTGTTLVPPPKFKSVKSHSTVSDGCGGHRKMLNFPPKH